MPRLDQIVEHLFSHPGSELTLETNSPGTYRQQGVPDAPVFRQTLRTGQILLLFADLVPAQDSQALLAGQPVDFRYDSPKGAIRVRMEMRGSDIHVLVKPFGTPPPRAAVVPATPPPPAAPPPAPTPLPVGQLSAAEALLRLLTELPERRASHLHLAPGQAPLLRVDGRLVAVPEAGVLTEARLREALGAVAPPPAREAVLKGARFDFTAVAPGSAYQVRGQEGRGGLQVVVRCLPRELPSPESLGLPPELLACLGGSGLFVLCGGAGQGTSTSLASVAQALLLARPAAVYTVEAPAELTLAPGQGQVQQLEVGTQVATMAEGLARARAADADLVVASEAAEPEALAQAVALAERGALVLVGLHARSAVEAAEQLLATVAGRPGLQRALGEALEGIFVQALVPNGAGGKSLAWELLQSSPEVRAALQRGEPRALKAHRAHTLDESLLVLVQKGELEPGVALSLAEDGAWLDAQLAARAA